MLQIDIPEYVMPELLVLIPVLSAIGAALKSSQLVKDKYIPILLGLLGSLFCGAWLVSSSGVTGYTDVAELLFSSIVQGVLCAGAAVYSHQITKQRKKEE